MKKPPHKKQPRSKYRLTNPTSIESRSTPQDHRNQTSTVPCWRDYGAETRSRSPRTLQRGEFRSWMMRSTKVSSTFGEELPKLGCEVYITNTICPAPCRMVWSATEMVWDLAWRGSSADGTRVGVIFPSPVPRCLIS